jgi:hypothetical protein
MLMGGLEVGDTSTAVGAHNLRAELKGEVGSIHQVHQVWE